MADLWLPGAVKSPQSGGVTLDTSLPARTVWHITWDALNLGQRPAFSAVSNYLKTQAYCPHLMWDPFTGYIEQFYPANVGGRALVNWNQDGAVNLQIEVFFSPGTIYNGKKYDTVADTPKVGLDKIMAWVRSHGVPDRWPLGAPKWSGNSRNADTWNAAGGHYGHCHVPDNTHSDPGPMGDIFAVGKTPAKDGFDMASLSDLQKIVDAAVSKLRKNVAVDVLSYKAKGRTKNVHDTIVSTEAEVAAIKGTVLALAKNQGLDPAKVQATIDAAVKASLADIEITLSADGK